MRFLSFSLASAVTVLALVPVARAQDTYDPNPPPHIAFVEGSATLDREDLSEPAAPGIPLVPGDRVRTDRGRVEVLFPDGSALDVDEFTEVELQSPTQLRVTSGRVLLFVAAVGNPTSAARFQFDTPAASAQTFGPGEYRVTVGDGRSGLETELAVIRGSGTLVTDSGAMPLRAGERSVAWDNSAPSTPQYFNSARFDPFERWATARRDERIGSRSAQYLPSDLRMYSGAMDRYGRWGYEAPYGYVWYPTVAIDWRPYYDGYWSSVPRYGWTWIGADIWSWPTHHYGRWGFGRRWYWIPERRFAPAWVTWGSAPGYVSWCPLGYDNRPVFGLSVSIGNRWAGWTIQRREHFGLGRRGGARQYALPGRSLPANTPFLTHHSAPVVSGRAIPRGAAGRASASRTQPTYSDRRGLPSGSRFRDSSRPSTSPADGSRTAQPIEPGNRGAYRYPNSVRERTPRPSDPVIEPRPDLDTGRTSRAPGVASSPQAPPAPDRPDRPRYGGYAIPRRPEAHAPSAPVQPPAPDRPEPGGGRAYPRYRQPQAADAPASSAPPPSARAERPAASPPERDGGRARSRGGDRSGGDRPSTGTAAPRDRSGGGGNGPRGRR